MPRVSLTPQAEESRLEIWGHIARDSHERADRFIDRIDAKCRQYARQPEMGDPRPDFVVHGARDIPTLFRDVFGDDA
ncbi:MAG: type II toxin-antitoxin system RelE/ParE family toxin [Planctomycetales bacterium]